MDRERLQFHLEQLWQQHAEHRGHHWTVCTHVADWLAQWFQRHCNATTAIVGYFVRDNPTARIPTIEDGHDFLLLADRYIVDFWQKEIWDPDHPLFIDTDTDDHLVTLYGDPLLWEAADEQYCAALSRYQRAYLTRSIHACDAAS